MRVSGYRWLFVHIVFISAGLSEFHRIYKCRFVRTSKTNSFFNYPSCILLKNCQTHFQNLGLFTPQVCLAIFEHYAWNSSKPPLLVWYTSNCMQEMYDIFFPQKHRVSPECILLRIDCKQRSENIFKDTFSSE